MNNIEEKIKKLVPFHEENFIVSDIEYGFQLTVNIWQLISLDKIKWNKLLWNWTDNFDSFKTQLIDKEVDCFYEVKEDFHWNPVITDDKRIFIIFSLKSKTDIWQENANDTVTLEQLLDNAIKLVDFFKEI